MAFLAHSKVKFATISLLLVALISLMSPAGHAATLPTVHDSLLFTVYPNKTVGVGWNSTTNFPVNQTTASLFQGSSIQSSSSFAQQSNAVVETTNVQYQFPAQVYTQVPYNLLDSVTLSATEAGNSSSGSLSLTTGFAVRNANVTFATSQSRISANATALIYFSQSTYNGTPFANMSIFQTTWMKTFQNSSWTDNIVAGIENATSHSLVVHNFNGTITSLGSTSATIAFKFLAIPSGSSTDFVTALENSLSSTNTPLPAGIDSIIRSALKLVTGESLTLNYSNTTGKLTLQYTTTYVSNLDAQVNSIKNQFFQLVLNLQPANTITPQERFLNATSATVSKISTTSTIDLYAGTYSTTLTGLMITPQVVNNSNNNFTIPGLFQTLGSVNFTAPGISLTLAGGSDSSNQVKVVVPAGTTPPTSTTSNSATWMNLKNASALQNVQFIIQPIPNTLLTFLTSPTGITIIAIIAAAIIATIVVLARRSRSKTPSLSTPTAPANTPGVS